MNIMTLCHDVMLHVGI